MMFKRFVIFLVLLPGLVVAPAVAALGDKVLVDETAESYTFTGGSGTGTAARIGTRYASDGTFANLEFSDAGLVQTLHYVVVEVPAWTGHAEGVHEFDYTLNGRTAVARMHVEYVRNALSVHTHTRYTFFFDDWNVSGMQGGFTVATPTLYSAGGRYAYYVGQTRTGDSPVYVAGDSDKTYSVVCSSGVLFKNRIRIVLEDYGNTVSILLNRLVDGVTSASTLEVSHAGTVVYSDYGVQDLSLWFLSRDVSLVTLISPSETFEYSLSGATGDIPCTINVYDADTRLPLSGDWDYYIVIQGSDAVSGSASGASTVVNLPETSILEPHLLRVTKEGYEQSLPLAFDVPIGGREVNVYLTPLETVAPEGSSVVTFVVTDIETGTPRNQCLVNVDGVAKYAGASGTVWFVLPENTTHEWVVTAEGYWPIGGNFTLGTDDLTIPVAMTKKTSDLPRPPLPDLPNLPVIHPSLDPAGFRMQILSVPYLGDMAEPLLDTVDHLAAGVNDIAFSVLDVLTAPADSIVLAVQGVSSQLVEVSEAYLSTGALVLESLGMLIAVIPTKVINLVTFGMILDIIILLLRGGL